MLQLFMRPTVASSAGSYGFAGDLQLVVSSTQRLDMVNILDNARFLFHIIANLHCAKYPYYVHDKKEYLALL